MRELELNESFLIALRDKFPKQSMLITAVEEILQIERESAYRRIKGIVQFTIREMGLLARHLDISIDSLIVENQTIVTQLDILSPRVENSMDLIIKRKTKYMERVIETSNAPNSEMGAIYTYLPAEFYIPYDNLSRFMYYIWGIYYIGPEKYRDFTTWKVPPELLKFHQPIMDAYYKLNKLLYIWEESVIWDLINHIKYLASAGLINAQDIAILKKELHQMLTDMERLISSGGPSDNTEKIEFYIAHIKVGLTYTYMMSKDYKGCFIATTPVLSPVCENKATCTKVIQWIKSIKKVSTLVSGSGDKERILFFKNQHQIVDTA